MSHPTNHGRNGRPAFGDHSFALCLTHDVDRPYKTVQAPYQAIRERDASHLRPLYTDEQPYWCFEDIMAIEEEFDARSSFYFLEEKHITAVAKRRWLHPRTWLRFTGYYSLSDPDIRRMIQRLSAKGWEVGIHGSFDSYADPHRFGTEKAALEGILDEPILGGRQHFLNLDRPDTWRIHREHGLRYDASLGSSIEFGFHNGYGVKRPFDDEFVVFPLTLMEVALRQGDRSFADAKQIIDRLVEQAAQHGAIMTVLWHVRLFNEDEFPGYRRLYRYLLERATEADAWIGPVRDAYRAITDVADHSGTAITQ